MPTVKLNSASGRSLMELGVAQEDGTGDAWEFSGVAENQLVSWSVPWSSEILKIASELRYEGRDPNPALTFWLRH